MDTFICLEWAKNKLTFLTGMPCTLPYLSNETAALFCCWRYFFSGWLRKPSSSGNVMKSHRASWVLVQVSDSYILVSNAQCTVQWGLFLILRQSTHSTFTLSCSSIAEGTSLLRKETKPLPAFPPQRSTLNAFVFKAVFPRFHQLLKTTCRSLEDWVAHFTQVKWQDSESVLLCEIRRHASIATVVARLWKKNTAVSFLDWLLGNKLKLVQFMVGPWYHHFMRNSSPETPDMYTSWLFETEASCLGDLAYCAR